jgi:hypothetical protein
MSFFCFVVRAIAKKIYVHLSQKVPFVLACKASAAPRPENSDSDKKYALFGLGTQMTNLNFIKP